MAERSDYLSYIKENSSPLLSISQRIKSLTESNKDKFGCIVENNGFYNRIILGSQFTSNNKRFNLQSELSRTIKTGEVQEQQIIFLHGSSDVLYRLDMNYESEDRILELAQTFADVQELSLFVNSFLQSYAYLDDSTLVRLSDNWAECQWSAAEVEKVLTDASDFQFPQGIMWQGDFSDLSVRIQEFFDRTPIPARSNS